MASPERKTTLTIRVLRGDPIKGRGAYPLPSFEVVFVVKDGPKSLFPPYAVAKSYEEYAELKDNLERINVGKGLGDKSVAIESEFPPPSDNKEELKHPHLIKEPMIKQRLEMISAWLTELFELIGEMDDPVMKTRICRCLGLFFNWFFDDPVDADEEQETEAARDLRLVAESLSALGMGPNEAKNVRGKRLLDEEVERRRTAEDEAIAAKNRKYRKRLATTQQEIHDLPRNKTIRACLESGYKSNTGRKEGRSRQYKRKVKKLRGPQMFAKQMACINMFESRFDSNTGLNYFFNPHTGETILDPSYMNRQQSYWMEIDPNYEKRDTVGILQELFPLWFGSRTNAKKRDYERFTETKNLVKASTVLTACARGFIQRRRLRYYYYNRYYKVLDKRTGYYYYFDTTTEQTSWFKPLCAYAYAILPAPLDLRDSSGMQDAGFSDGPLLTKGAKGGTRRWHPKRVVAEDDESEEEPEPEIPDLQYGNFLMISLWMDTNVQKLEKMQPLWNAYKQRDWTTLLKNIVHRSDDDLVQLFAFHAIVRMDVEYDKEAGTLMPIITTVLHYCCDKLVSYGATMPYGCNMLLGLLSAIHALLQDHAARVEFFRYKSAKNVGDEDDTLDDEKIDNAAIGGEQEDAPKILKQGALEKFWEKKVMIFARLVRDMPLETTYEQIDKDLTVPETPVTRPTKRTAEMSILLLKCLGLLAHERESREIVAAIAIPFVLQVLRDIFDEPYIVSFALKCLYNFVYMCFEAWRVLTVETDVMKILRKIRGSHLCGHEDVARELRRVELALEENGWRGFVEEKISEEMQESLQAQYQSLQAAKEEAERSLLVTTSLDAESVASTEMREELKQSHLRKGGIDQDAEYRREVLVHQADNSEIYKKKMAARKIGDIQENTSS